MGTTVEFHEEAFDDLMRSEVTDDLLVRAAAVEERQRDLINDRTGRLSRSVETLAAVHLGDDVAVAVGSSLYYASYVNDGTVHAGARPFVEPSAAAAK